MNYTYRAEYVRCGKSGCRSCPHGPYWYGYWKENGRTRKKYFGRDDPRAEEAPEAEYHGEPEPIHPHDAILSKKGGSMALACEILGISTTTSLDDGKKAYRVLSLKHHPDRGGDNKMMIRINAAWDYFRSVRGMRK